MQHAAQHSARLIELGNSTPQQQHVGSVRLYASIIHKRSNKGNKIQQATPRRLQMYFPPLISINLQNPWCIYQRRAGPTTPRESPKHAPHRNAALHHPQAMVNDTVSKVNRYIRTARRASAQHIIAAL